MDRTARIATRSSPLALRQANSVKDLLECRFPGRRFELVTVRAAGDEPSSMPIPAGEGTGVFTSRLEKALLDGRADMAVHSLKDLPTALAPGLVLAAVPARGDVRDAVILKSGAGLRDLAANAVVATGSPRRRAQLLHMRPDLRFVGLRGNVETRLDKFRQGRFDAVVLAVCGLERLGLGGAITERIPTAQVLPAPGQAAIAVEARSDDGETLEMAESIDDRHCRAEVEAERAFLRATGGGCRVPVAALGVCDGEGLHLVGLVAAGDGTLVLRDEIAGSPENAVELGVELARKLRASGAEEILAVFEKGSK